MDKLIPIQSLDMSGFSFDEPQRSGAMTVVPLFGEDHPGDFILPASGLKLSGVETYGKVVLENAHPTGVCIVPLHIGYIQDQAQNHALCSSLFIGAGQKVTVKDACCVQASQGGYLEGANQWFFVLPLSLREKALELRGKEEFGKLWDHIAELNRDFGLQNRGHLEQILSRKKAYLNQYEHRFELQPGQRGALFFVKNRLAGIEIAPTEAYFKDIWKPLVCFSYGASAMLEEEVRGIKEAYAAPLSGSNLAELKESLFQSRKDTALSVENMLRHPPKKSLSFKEEERYTNLVLSTVTNKFFSGQVVFDGETLIYASIFARKAYFA
ncbi:MAG: hypothetical protein GY754_00470 [bacterium]|nr:hypothetical protein [bacterium]